MAHWLGWVPTHKSGSGMLQAAVLPSALRSLGLSVSDAAAAAIATAEPACCWLVIIFATFSSDVETHRDI